MKRIVVQVVNRFGYRRVLVATTLGLSLVTLLFMTTALLGWYYVLPFVLFLQGMVNSTRFSSMNTLTLKDLPDNLASSGNSLLSMIMQLSMSIGVTIAGLKYVLEGAALANTVVQGVSNEFVDGSAATVSVESGTLIVTFPIEAPLPVVRLRHPFGGDLGALDTTVSSALAVR